MTQQAVVLDIEGTTTPISFVYDILFPYAREHVGSFLRAHADSPEVQKDLEDLAAQAAEDVEEGLPGARTFEPSDLDAAASNVRWQMDADRKTTALKSLQGKIWKSGYADGTLRGVVFDDVPAAMKRWTKAGKIVAIYSSGSIAAQKLLFANSTAGDLTPFITDYFDTTTGPKREWASYDAIARSLGIAPERIVFATDVLQEAEAADTAGLRAVIMKRPGNAALPHHRFETHETFAAL